MRPATNEVRVERDVAVPAPDGAVLLTDIYHPVDVAGAPTILERTPYGRAGIATMAGPDLARRGYRYVLQACRGTDGSGGSHSYFVEAADGRATADWIAEQPQFDGRLGSYGASYMGFTQWALASTRPPHLKAMAVALSTSVRAYSWYPGGALALELIIPWDLGALAFNKPQTAQIAEDLSPEAIDRRMAELRAAFDHLPLGEVMRRFGGEDLPLDQEQLAHVDDDHWAPVDLRPLLAGWTVPTLLVDGWHDYPLPGVIEDYRVLRNAGDGGHLVVLPRRRPPRARGAQRCHTTGHVPLRPGRSHARVRWHRAHDRRCGRQRCARGARRRRGAHERGARRAARA